MAALFQEESGVDINIYDEHELVKVLLPHAQCQKQPPSGPDPGERPTSTDLTFPKGGLQNL